MQIGRANTCGDTRGFEDRSLLLSIRDIQLIEPSPAERGPEQLLQSHCSSHESESR